MRTAEDHYQELSQHRPEHDRVACRQLHVFIHRIISLLLDTGTYSYIFPKGS